MPPPSLLQRLKERKLVQWAVAYLAGAWVLVEATNLVVEQFLWPQVVGQVVTILAFFGFFVVLVITWYHGEKGRQWVSGPELAIIALLLLISGGVLSMLRGGGESSGPTETPAPAAVEHDRPSVAVLPCTNMSPDPADEYLAASLHDEILLKLQGISSLFSIGRASVEWYRDHPAPLTQVAQELGVGFVGECSVQKHEEQIRLIFQLLDGRTGGQVWADDYDRDLTIGNLFDIQSDIAQRIAHAIGAELTSEDQARIAARPTDDLEAYELYLLGRQSWNRFTEEGIRRSIERYQETIATDSSYAPAYAGLADAYHVLGLGLGQGAADPLEVMPMAKEAVGTGLDLDPNLAEALSTLGMITYTFDFGYAEAERLLLRAIEQNPNSAIAHARYALLLSTVGRHEEAIEAIGRARALDPLRPIIATDRGFILLHAGRVEEALTAAMEAQDLAPQFPFSHELMGRAYMARSEWADAILPFRRAIELTGGNPRQSTGLGYALARSGDEAAARMILGDVVALAEHRYVNPTEIGYLYLGLGEDEEALTWFERAVDGHAGWVIWLQYYPGTERLRSHPRYQELLRRMNLQD